jgi:hypothetical protein
MKYLKKFNEEIGNPIENETPTNSEPVENLVERILDACKLDVDAIKESDPEFIGYIGDMIQEWTESHENSKSEKIDWDSIEDQWDNWYEKSNGEADYDDEYDAMKSFVKGVEVEWSEVKKEYFDYIEETYNEEDYDDKFNKFKSLVKKNLK